MGEIFVQAETLWYREVVRFIRQPIRVMSAIATPLVFWLLLGAACKRRSSRAGCRPESTTCSTFIPA